MARKYEGMASGVYYQGESRAMALAGGGAMSTTAGGRWRGAGLQQAPTHGASPKELEEGSETFRMNVR